MKRFFQIMTLLLATLFLTSCGNGLISEEENNTINLSTNNKEIMQQNGTEVSFEIKNDAEMRTEAKAGDTIATFNTTEGVMKAILYTEEAPITTENFIELVNQGKYAKVPFHRVINDFMIQTGDFENQDGTGGYSNKGPGTLIQDEFGKGLKHIKGAISMANRGPNTGGSQFFIVQKEDGTDWLDGRHAIFGYVYEGHDVLDKIARAETNANDNPVKEIMINSIEISTVQ